MKIENPEVALMFSGGRDSSLAACLYILRGSFPHLLSFQTGLGVSSGLRDLRYQELQDRFGEALGPNPILPAYGIVRKIATSTIESDFRDFDGKNLILLGEKLALHAATVVYALKNNITRIADGTSGYQSYLPEQRDVSLQIFADLAAAYDISYETPIREYESEEDVKYGLFDLGISTKSLEGISMFADAFSEADSSTIRLYLKSKESLFHDHIEMLMNGNRPVAFTAEALSAVSG